MEKKKNHFSTRTGKSQEGMMQKTRDQDELCQGPRGDHLYLCIYSLLMCTSTASFVILSYLARFKQGLYVKLTDQDILPRLLLQQMTKKVQIQILNHIFSGLTYWGISFSSCRIPENNTVY